MMGKKRQISKVIEANSSAIMNGQETVDSIIYRHPHESKELQPQLEAISWLGQARKGLEPRQDFIVSLGKYLQQQIENLPRPNLWQRLFKKFSPQRWVFNITAPIVVIFMLALVLNSLVLTARLSIPGDPFYSSKLLIENTRLAFTFNPVDKTDLYIEFSRERTTEIVQLVLEGDYERITSTADRLETELIASLHALNDISAHNPAAEIPMVETYKDTLSNEIFMLGILRDTSPLSARPGIDLAIQVAQSGMMALH
jgi:hypothetical protein